MSRRTDRMGDLLRSELSNLLLRRMSDPRVQLVTLTEVAVSADLRRAVVRVSVLGEESERLRALEALHHARGFLRSELAHQVRNLRVVPELVFELDRGAEHSQRIHDLLEDLHGEDDRS